MDLNLTDEQFVDSLLPPEVPEVAKEVGAFTTWKEKLDKPIATIPWVVDSLLSPGS